ncbi:cytochrome P450 [Sphingosinicella soli]|uniref:Cytochrome P450 n=1 Tax=Sphingosinicella soli TaxID=333708 RepID=A0A7W7AYV6_9SPHN|nr:cytochrome P450 [Sphingosinicella soli]MBB4630910.1 cytochrome P450 [Sphingosinicella soli]
MATKVAVASDLGATDPADYHHFIEQTWPALFARLRAEDPVHYCTEGLFAPYWSVTRYKDIVHVEALPDIYSSSWEYGGITVLDALDRELKFPMFIAMDRPQHTAERRVVAPAFTPSEMQRLAGQIRARTAALLDTLPVGETFDWVDSVSIELTTQMLAILFDFPWEDRRLLTTWSDWAGDVQAAADPALREERTRNLFEMGAYFRGLWQARLNAPPAPDLISMMIHSEAMSKMDEQEFIGNLVLLIVGGNDTTRNSMTGLAGIISAFPGEWAKLKADRSLIPNAVSELIRWQTPLSHMRRTATEDTELGGKTIRKGDKVVMWYISANRDTEVFADPDRVDFSRENARRHLSFGYGIHRCVGARLAELQLSILIEEMLERGMDLETVAQPVRVPSPFINGYKEQKVRIRKG